MILQGGERGIASEQVEAAVGDQLQSGYLYLTNARLVFEGLFLEPTVGWAPRTLLDLQLGQISNVVAMPGRRDRHTLRVEAGRGFVYTFVTPNAMNWVQSIVQAKRSASAAPAPAAPPSPGAPVVVNIQQSSTAPAVFLHCRHCGTLAPAGAVHCTGCGAPL